MIATANLGELLDTTALLAAQPVPAGRRVGIVANTRGGGVLAADACGDVGLRVATLAGKTQRALRDLLPAVATVARPVDTTSAVRPGQFRRCLELVAADPGVDAVLAVTATTATSDMVAEVCAARLPVPVAAAIMDQTEAVRLLPGPGGNSPAVPAYAYPESAGPGPRPRRALRNVAGDPAGERPRTGRPEPGPGARAGGQLPGQNPSGRLAAPPPGGGAARLLWRAAAGQRDGHHRGRRGGRGGPVRRAGGAAGGRAGPVRGSRASGARLDLHGADEVRCGFGWLRRPSATGWPGRSCSR